MLQASNSSKVHRTFDVSDVFFTRTCPTGKTSKTPSFSRERVRLQENRVLRQLRAWRSTTSLLFFCCGCATSLSTCSSRTDTSFDVGRELVLKQTSPLVVASSATRRSGPLAESEQRAPSVGANGENLTVETFPDIFDYRFFVAHLCFTASIAHLCFTASPQRARRNGQAYAEQFPDTCLESLHIVSISIEKSNDFRDNDLAADFSCPVSSSKVQDALDNCF